MYMCIYTQYCYTHGDPTTTQGMEIVLTAFPYYTYTHTPGTGQTTGTQLGN